jgi:hypothetical protein
MRTLLAGEPTAAVSQLRPAAFRHALIALCIVGGLAGCASTPPPTGEIATARAALDAARREGAAQHAATALGDAEDRLARAERAGAARDYEIARRLAEEARVTAEVAAEATRLAKLRTARDALQRSTATPSADTGARGATVAPVSPSTVVPVSPPPSAPAAAPGTVPASPAATERAPGSALPAPR